VELCAGLGRLASKTGVRVVFYQVAKDGKLRETRLAGLGSGVTPGNETKSPEIFVRTGDIFLFPNVVVAPDGPRPKEVRKLRSFGAHVFFICYDLLPITHPDFFRKFSRVVYRQWFEAVLESDGVLFISHATKSEFDRIVMRETGNSPVRTRNGVLFLASSQPPAGIVKKSSLRNFVGKEDFNFLMVGTLEPRKGYSEVLDAFDRLWAKGAGHTLTIVGAPGWKTDILLSRIRKHPEFRKKLRWWPEADDSLLWELYAGSDALIANSVAEGFGLPLVEAAHVGLPIIAARIDSFVEIAGDNAFYINPDELGSDGLTGVEKAVREWCDVAKRGVHPDSRGIEPRSWDQVSEELLDLLLKKPEEAS
jgi:glycosyltransferase involved in cell wall biosynthesis